MGGFGKIGTGLAAIGGFIPVYGTAIAAIGSVAATLDAESADGNVALPHVDPWARHGYLWGVANYTLDAWGDQLTGVTDHSTSFTGGQVRPFTDYPFAKRLTAADAAALGTPELEGTLERLPVPGPPGAGLHRYHATSAARERGAWRRIPHSAVLIHEQRAGGGFPRPWEARRKSFNASPLGNVDSVLVNWKPPFGGPVVSARELLDRWAAKMAEQASPDFSAYLDNRGWLDNPWTTGGGTQTWEESVPLQQDWGKPGRPMLPAWTRAEWVAEDPMGHRGVWAERLAAEMGQWAADEDEWHSWRFEAKVQLAKDTAKKELTQAFEGYVEDALASGLDEHAAMQAAMSGLAAQIGGVSPPVALPDPNLALAQAQAAYGEAVEGEVIAAATAQEHVTPDDPPAPPRSKVSAPLLAAASAAVVGLLLSR